MSNAAKPKRWWGGAAVTALLLASASLDAQSPHASDLHAPVRLEADGKPIDIATLSDYAHAGPWVADVDGDGIRDLLVGDFPGHFHFFKNIGTDRKPRYTAKGKLQAGGADAKTPVY